MVPSSLFILASSVCKSLQCLISALTQGGKSCHLCGLPCSGVLWERRNTVNKYHWHVLGVLAVSEAHWICPSSWRRVLSRSTLLRLQLTLQGSCPKAGPGLHAFSRPSHQVPFLGYSTEALLGWACFLCPSQLREARAARCLRSAVSQVCGASYRLPGPSPSVSWVCHESAVSGVPVCLLWGADLSLQPSWQMSAVQDPRKTCLAVAACSQLVEDANSGVKTAPCLLTLAIARLPLCLRRGGGPVFS